LLSVPLFITQSYYLCFDILSVQMLTCCSNKIWKLSLFFGVRTIPSKLLIVNITWSGSSGQY